MALPREQPDGRVHEERNDNDHLRLPGLLHDQLDRGAQALRRLAALNEGASPGSTGRPRGSCLTGSRAYPLRNNRWGPFFEDVSTKDYSDTEINADTLAVYILEHPGWDPEVEGEGEGDPRLDHRTFANNEARSGASWSSTSRPPTRSRATATRPAMRRWNSSTRRRRATPPAGTPRSGSLPGRPTGSTRTGRTSTRGFRGLTCEFPGSCALGN